MELKTYQKQVMDDLSSYLGHLKRNGDMFAAWQGDGMRPPRLHQSPHRRRKDLHGLCCPQTHF